MANRGINIVLISRTKSKLIEVANEIGKLMVIRCNEMIEYMGDYHKVRFHLPKQKMEMATGPPKETKGHEAYYVRVI